MTRKPGRLRSALTLGIPAAALAAGIVAGPLRSSQWSWRSPILTEVEQLTSLAPVSALPRTETVIATLEAQRYLDSGRPYAAWEALQSHIGADGVTGAAATLLAARAAAGWGAWREAKQVLEGRDWLETASEAEGLLLLARAQEETGNPRDATASYRRYVGLSNAGRKGIGFARLANLLSQQGEHDEAAASYAQAAGQLPELADWLKVLQVEELVASNDPSATTIATRLTGGSPAVRQRRVQLEAKAWVANAESRRAIERLDWESRILSAGGATAEAAQLNYDRAELMLRTGQEAEGRALLAEIARLTTATSDVRLAAARKLDEVAGLSADHELAESYGYEAAAQPGLAARSLRAAFAAGLPETGEQRLRLARLLYEERDFSQARGAFQRAAEMLEDREAKADAELYAARSLFRSGGNARQVATQKANALEEFRRIVDRYDGTPAAGTALFLLGDEAATTQAGLAYYRRAAEVLSSPDAREALNRVGDRSLKLKDTAAAIRAWEQYVARYPKGEETARIAYQVGKLHESAGRRDKAEAMFVAAMQAEPTSYYGVRAGQRIDRSSVEHVLAGARSEPLPWTGLASDPGEAHAVLRRMDLLAEIGRTAEREAELQSALRKFANRPLVLITLAEGLSERKEAVKAINLGRTLLAQREGRWDDRLLRVVFPFPYRELIETEAKRRRLDPLLLAALIRQESSFRYDATSWVGAKGLGQIMPATGRELARALGIANYSESLLVVPEVNVRMAAKYLGDLMNRFDDASDLALSGYNAGPGRAVTWRRTLNYGRDTDAFRAAIPFDETRNYVMLVSRNHAVYQALYGE